MFNRQKMEVTMRTLAILVFSIFLTNCAYQPLINPETSRDKFNGDNIAGNYWKDLASCEYIFEKNSFNFGIPPSAMFIQKCMKGYGYNILR